MLCTMKTWSKSPLMLLKLICITLLPVLEAQSVRPKVTGYLKHDVALPCSFIPGPENTSVEQVQWNLLQTEGETIPIIISNKRFGVNTPDSSLKERVEIDGLSLVIKDVEMRDAGSYMCTATTFPTGSFEGTVDLVVQEQMPLSSGVVSAIVIAVILLLGIVAAIASLIFTRRRDSLVRHRVFIDTGGTVMDVARPSVTVREEDVVYSDVNFKPFRDVTPSSIDKNTDITYSDVTYAEVVIGGQQPK